MVAALTAGSVFSASASQKSTIEAVLEVTPFKTSEARALRRGETLHTELREVSKRELAGGVACLIRTDSDTSGFEVIREAQQPLIDESLMIDFGLLDPSSDDVGLPLRSLGEQAQEESERLVAFGPGKGFNLSLEEIDQLQALGAESSGKIEPAEVEAIIRRQLEKRLHHYHKLGLDGMADYARGGDRFASPSRELRSSVEADLPLQQLFPELHGSWLAYPEVVPEGAGEQFYWAQLDIEDRPLTLLVHRIDARFDERHIVGEMYFYASRFFDTGYSLTALVPVEEGFIFFYVNRYWIDYWSGMAGFKQRAGRRVMGGKMLQRVEASGICS